MKSKLIKFLHGILELPVHFLKFISGRLYERAIRVFKIGPYKGYVVREIFSVLNSSDYKTSREKIGELERIVKEASERGEFENWTQGNVAIQKNLSLAKWKSMWTNKYWNLQLFFIPANHEHPPHFHHNLSSFFIVQKGSLRMREYEKISIKDDVITLKEMRNEVLVPYMSSVSTELYRNAHWFSTEDKSVIGLNFNMRGYEEKIVDKSMRTRGGGRRYIDMANHVREGDIISAKVISNVNLKVNGEL